ncbi:hypothetical protein C8J57DRAFT_1368781 [Mycena rebaudengoi]|nr:hypothetical protein C8J57DRAFT_1368781 [Mycena rebaudengoi]
MDSPAADADTSDTSPTRVIDLWFPDANLVIRVGGSLFKVFRGILATKSPVFEDMLSFPQPEDSELIDGCPVVRLFDSEKDAEYFLRALFHYDFFEPYPAEVDFETVAGVLRLSQKYQVEHLRKRALLHLSERYPTSLADWDTDSKWTHLHVEAVNLAREVSALWILPLALYRCCDHLGISALLSGDTRLDERDYRRCVEATLQLHTTHTSFMLDFLLNPASIPGCLSAAHCVPLRMHYRRTYDRLRHARLPLNVMRTSGWEFFQVCAPCLAHMKERHAAAMEECWADLPAIFDVLDWESLEDMKRAALG